MSYILDALRKSEQEQARLRAPDIHASHDAVLLDRERASRISLALVAAAAALAAMLVTTLVVSPGLELPRLQRSPVPAAPAEPAAVTESPPAITRPAQTIVAPAPSLAFSAHVYASDPSLRSVTINGVRYREGERIDDALLREITEDGVVLERDGKLVKIDVLHDWMQ